MSHAMDAVPYQLCRRAVDVLDREYKLIDWAANPTKVSLPIRHDADGKLSAYFNVMTSKLSTGHFGGKYIFVDDLRGEFRGDVFVFGKNGEQLFTVASQELTRLRCALMAIMAAQRFYGAEIFSELRFGFIGSGKINALTAQILRNAYGVPAYRMTVKASPRHPYKSHSTFPEGVNFTRESRDLAYASTVFVCTNLREKSEVYEVNDLVDFGQIAPLFITQDGGWTLGRTWRAPMAVRANYADHIDQILTHAVPGDDYDFPWDETPPRQFLDLNDGSFRRRRGSDGPAVVYLSGMAMADLVVSILQAEISL
jgi:hypothetical protein